MFAPKQNLDGMANPSSVRAAAPDLLIEQAAALESEGRPAEAVAILMSLLEDYPSNGDVHLRLGLLLDSLGESDKALRFARSSVELLPDRADAHLLLGMLFAKGDQIFAAVPHFNCAAQLDPTLGAAGIRFLEQLLEKTAQRFEEVLTHDPLNVQALLFLAKMRQLHCRPLEAHELLQRSLNLRPHDPEIRYNLAFAELLLGRFESGWANYESRFDIGGREFPRRDWLARTWSGDACPNATILVFSEQGLGDTIQFCRYIPLLKPYCRNVIFECRPELARLMAVSFPDLSIITSSQTVSGVDFQVPLMSLPRIFNTRLETIPAQIPYLNAPRKVSLPRSHDCGLKVGLAWAGNPALQNDLWRSLPFSALEPLLNIRGITFYSLQMGLGRQPLLRSCFFPDVIDLASRISDLADTASFIAQMDVVISVDTVVAHLAGALGRPVWILLPHGSEWRWLMDREDSPWYPSARLFRQPRPGAWPSVVGQLTNVLGALVSGVRSNQVSRRTTVGNAPGD